jgi:hypothetical protein
MMQMLPGFLDKLISANLACCFSFLALLYGDTSKMLVDLF